MGVSGGYYELLDSYSPAFSITLAEDGSDRLSSVTTTVVNAPTYNAGYPTTETAVTNTAADFDGINDDITIPWVAGYQVGTWIFWYKGTGVGTGVNVNADVMALLVANSGSSHKRWHFGLTDAGKLQAAYSDQMTNATSPSAINDDVWHMVAVTINDAGTDELKLHIDGSEVDTQTASNVGTGSPLIHIAGLGRGSVEGEGQIAEIAYTSTIMTEAQVAALYATRDAVAAGGGGGTNEYGDVLLKELQDAGATSKEVVGALNELNATTGIEFRAAYNTYRGI